MATYTIKISAGTGISNFTYYYYDASYTYRGPMTSSSVSLPVYSGTDVYISSVSFSSGYTYPVKCGGWTMYNEYGYADDPYIRSNANRTLTISATKKTSTTQYRISLTAGTGVSDFDFYYYQNGTYYGPLNSSSISFYADYGTKVYISNIYPETNYGTPYYLSDGSKSWDWSTDKYVDVVSARSITVSGTVRESTYYGRITLNANGGRFTTNSSTTQSWPANSVMSNTGVGSAYVSTNLPTSGSSYIPVYSGYTFVGWGTSADATSPTYYSGDTVGFTARSTSSSNPTNLTLYAVWRKVYTLTFTTTLSGVSNMPTPSTIAGAGYIMCPTTIPVKSGYTFLGWADTAGGAVRYVGGTNIYMSADKTIYAVFEKITLSSFYWTGSSSTDNTKIAKGQPVSNLTATSWNNYRTTLLELANLVGATASISTASSGSTITATMFNQARNGLVNIKAKVGGSTQIPDTVAKGDTILASMFVGVGSLRNALNGLINLYNSQ